MRDERERQVTTEYCLLPSHSELGLTQTGYLLRLIPLHPYSKPWYFVFMRKS